LNNSAIFPYLLLYAINRLRIIAPDRNEDYDFSAEKCEEEVVIPS